MSIVEPSIVVPDADTLFGSATRAFLIQLHDAGLIELAWSATLLSEMSGALVRAGRMTAQHAQTHEQRLRAHLPDVEVSTREVLAHLKSASALVRSAKDAHVAACALAAKSRMTRSHRNVVSLVSKNLKDFRSRELRALDVELSHPDKFLSALFREDSASVGKAFADFRSQLRSRESASSLLGKLAKDGQIVTASMLASAADAGDIAL